MIFRHDHLNEHRPLLQFINEEVTGKGYRTLILQVWLMSSLAQNPDAAPEESYSYTGLATDFEERMQAQSFLFNLAIHKDVSRITFDNAESTCIIEVIL